MKFKQILLLAVLSFASAFMGIIIYSRFFETEKQIFIPGEKINCPLTIRSILMPGRKLAGS